MLASLRARLVLLVLLCILPTVALLLSNAAEERRHATADARETALGVLREVSSDYERLIEGSRQLLTALSWVPAVRTLDAQVCGGLLADLVRNFPLYTNLVAATPDGDVVCAGIASREPVNLADRVYFQETLRQRRFTVGGHSTEPITGNANLAAGYPVLDPAGAVRGLLFAGLDLSLLSHHIAVQLPSESTITLVDKTGTILSAYPEEERWVGQTLPDAPIIRLALAEPGGGSAELPGLDGVRRFHVFAPFRDVSTGGIEIVVGVPQDPALAEVERMLRRNLSWVAVVMVLALLGAWFGGDVFVLRPLRALVNTARRLSAGDLGVRSGVPAARGELSHLAQAFDEMAEALESRDGVAKRIERGLRESNSALRAMIQASPLAVIALDVDDRVTTWNPAAECMFGWGEGDVLGRRLPLVPEYKQEEFRALRKRALEGETVAGLELRRQRKDGSPIDVRLWTASIRDAAGRIVGVFGLLEDITERKRAADALLKRTNQLEAIRLVNAEITRELELDTLLALIHRRAMELVGAGGGSLYLWDEATRQLVPKVWLGIPDDVGALMLQPGEGLCGIVAERGVGMLVNDYRTFPHAHSQFLASTGLTASLAEPLRYRDRLVGVIAVNHQDGGRSFSEEDQRLLSLFAAQAAIAIEKARLYDTTVTRSRQLATLSDLTRALTTELDPQVVTRQILEAVQVLVPGAAARLLEQVEGVETLRVVASVGLRQPDVGGSSGLRMGEGLAAVATSTRHPVACADVSQDPRFVNRVWAASEGLVSGIVLPLVHGDRVIGILSVFLRRPHVFTDEEIDLLRAFAGHGAIVLVNARLFEQVRLGRERLLDLTQRVVSVQEEERSHLSRELHDEASQALTAIRIGLGLVLDDLPADAVPLRRRLSETVTVVESITDRLRFLAQALRPPALETMGLDVTLAGLCRSFGRRTGLRIDYKGKNLPRIPDGVSIHLYRVVQEALTNVSKHAHASRVCVHLEYDGDLIRLLVEDDGVGFDCTTQFGVAVHSGIGLIGMRERLDLLSGRLDIASRPGRGTRLTAWVPWKESP